MAIVLAFSTVVLVWATTPLAMSWSLEGFPLTFTTMVRLVGGALSFWTVLLVCRHRFANHKKAWRFYLIGGTSMCLALTCSYIGAGYVSSGMLAVLFGLSPIGTCLLARWILPGESISRLKAAAMVLGCLGLAYVFESSLALSADAWIGVLYILAAVTFFCLGSVLGKKLGEGIDSLSAGTGVVSVAAVGFVCIWLVNGADIPTQLVLKPALTTGYLAVFGSCLAMWGYFHVLQQLPTSRVALMKLISPIFAVWLGVQLNGEQINASMLIGTALVITALLVFEWGDILVSRVGRVLKPLEQAEQT